MRYTTLAPVLALALPLALTPSPLTAQSAPLHLTENTLAYDSAAPRPAAMIGEMAWLAGHWEGSGRPYAGLSSPSGRGEVAS